MARYTGPKCRLCRREGIKLFLKGTRCMTRKCPIENPQVKGQYSRRDNPPGTERYRRRRKMSEYGKQLREKQRAKRYYGVLDKQFKRYYDKADRLRGNTGEQLLQILERRLDNVVYRLGWGTSHAQARQMVVHGHIRVNGRKVDRPSYQVRENDKLGVRNHERSKNLVKNNTELVADRELPSWLKRDMDELRAEIVELPDRETVGLDLNEALIVELLSR